MTRFVLFLLIAVFGFASAGLHKLVTYEDKASVEISFNDELIKAGMNHCCDTPGEENQVENPRCLGDNCLSIVSLPPAPEFFTVKMWIDADHQLTGLKLNRALRPPIL